MNAPRQMLLALSPTWTPSLDNFVAGANAELLARLATLADHRSFDALYLWGDAGCGKSHLLAATAAAACQRRPVEQLAGHSVASAITATPGALLLIDDVQQLGDEAQIALFRTINSARLLGLALLLSGPCPPLQLALREDLRTRIGQSLIYEVQPLSDAEKIAALQRHASQRGMRLDDSVLSYLLRHGRRDLPTLMAALDALDRASLEQKRQPTLPLLRELLQT